MRSNLFIVVSACMLALAIVAAPVMAAYLWLDSGSVTPSKYRTIKAAINSGKTGLVWEMQNPNIYYIKYRIAEYDTTTWKYSVKLFSNNHAEILDEIPVTAQAGTIQLHTKTYPAGTYWVNLMATLKGNEIQQDAFCQAHGYPCEISKNLDIIRMDIGTPAKSGDDYQTFIVGAIERSGQPVRGAAWMNR